MGIKRDILKDHREQFTESRNMLWLVLKIWGKKGNQITYFTVYKGDEQFWVTGNILLMAAWACISLCMCRWNPVKGKIPVRRSATHAKEQCIQGESSQPSLCWPSTDTKTDTRGSPTTLLEFPQELGHWCSPACNTLVKKKCSEAKLNQRFTTDAYYRFGWAINF